MTSPGLKTTTASASGEDNRAYAAMVTRAAAWRHACAREREVAEQLRCLAEDTERELHKSGLFRIVQPKRVGGAELDIRR